MPSENTMHHDHALTDVGKRLFEVLTEEEVALLLEALLTTMPLALREQALHQLAKNTRLTVQHTITAKVEEVPKPVRSASMAKLEEIWTQLWQDWSRVVSDGSDENSKYLIQEDDWQPSYFDESGFVSDLEKITTQMWPLVEPAITYHFSPKADFGEALSKAEREVESSLPEWIELGAGDGFALEKSLTTCLLKSEWLFAQQRAVHPFDFALKILECEEAFRHTSLNEDAFTAFFAQLPEADQRVIFDGLDEHRHEEKWKCLKMAYSPWHMFYIDSMNRYAPERYLDALRETIPQKWQNGLPIIKDFLAKEAYKTSLDVVQETLNSMLSRKSNMNEWTPQQSLFYGHLSWHSSYNFDLEKQLLTYYEKAASVLGQTDLANTLAFQLLAFDHFFEWETMFKAFREKPLPNTVHQLLFRSWSQRLIQSAKPSTYWWGHRSYSRSKPVDDWWLLWLFDSIADEQKGGPWFQQKMSHWLTRFPTDHKRILSHQGFLRLLTEDLNAVNQSVQTQYPKFYNVVIGNRTTPSNDSASRQAYLQAYGSADLLDQVITCWKRKLRLMVPNPKDAKKSDYKENASWMTALQELDALEYKLLLTEWRDVHRRRRNLWRDMRRVGLM